MKQSGLEGRLVFFNEERGYGFIRPDGWDRDVFLHFTGLRAGHSRDVDLRDGVRMRFDVVKGDKEKAVNAEVLEDWDDGEGEER